MSHEHRKPEGWNEPIADTPLKHRKIRQQRGQYTVEYKWASDRLPFLKTNDWTVWRAYKTEKQRDQALAQLQRKDGLMMYRKG